MRARTRRYYFGGRTDPASSQVRRDLPWVEAYGNTEDACSGCRHVGCGDPPRGRPRCVRCTAHRRGSAGAEVRWRWGGFL